MIKVSNLNFSYDKNKEFIKDINFTIRKGEITTILGPNGSGKSTLLSILCGLNKAISGEVIINGEDINKLSYKKIAKKISTVHQSNSVPSDITVIELVGYGRLPHKKYFQNNKKEDDDIVNWAIERVGLRDLKHKVVMEMSGGERQRVFLAMALAQKSEILFLDEPTTYLDIYHQVELLELVKELKETENLTIVMVLHDINQALAYSDNVIIMKNGKLVDEGRTSDIINMKLLNEVYNIGGVLENYQDSMYFIPMKRKNNDFNFK